MEGPISLWGYKEQESNLILPGHDDDDEVEHVFHRTDFHETRKLPSGIVLSSSLPNFPQIGDELLKVGQRLTNVIK